jgi:hypothetical protein
MSKKVKIKLGMIPEMIGSCDDNALILPESPAWTMLRE